MRSAEPCARACPTRSGLRPPGSRLLGRRLARSGMHSVRPFGHSLGVMEVEAGRIVWELGRGAPMVAPRRSPGILYCIEVATEISTKRTSLPLPLPRSADYDSEGLRGAAHGSHLSFCGVPRDADWTLVIPDPILRVGSALGFSHTQPEHAQRGIENGASISR